MNIRIYNASWSSFGGGEKYICTIADMFSRLAQSEVILLVDRPDITVEHLHRYFNLQLQNVLMKQIRKRDIAGELRQADLAVIVSNFRPYGTPGRRTVYILQIPYPPITALTLARKALAGEVKDAAKDLFRLALLRDARRADAVLVYSEFVRQALQRHHGIHSEVLYPAIDDFALDVPGEHAILSVGRFFTGPYNDKRYDILIGAFKTLCARLPNSSWQYWLAGSCGTDKRSLQYLEDLRKAATGFPIYFHVNCPYAELRRLYNQAAIFWHAAGFGVDEERSPDRMEHFGMSTVEAMSASCAPVVINKGGQKEIVSHGESGYLWNTLEELVGYTVALIEDGTLLGQMQNRARTRSTEFDHEHFSRRLQALIPA